MLKSWYRTGSLLRRDILILARRSRTSGLEIRFPWYGALGLHWCVGVFALSQSSMQTAQLTIYCGLYVEIENICNRCELA